MLLRGGSLAECGRSGSKEEIYKNAEYARRIRVLPCFSRITYKIQSVSDIAQIEMIK